MTAKHREWLGRDLCRGCGRDSCLGSSQTLSPIPAQSSGSSRSQPSDPPDEAPSLQTNKHCNKHGIHHKTDIQ